MRWCATNRKPRVFAALWVVFICACVMPWTDIQDHPHWARVQWIPFVTPPLKLRDLVANVLLYLPFGYWMTALSSRRRPWRALVSAALLSLVTEWTQLYSHSRFPSMTDVTCNLAGTALGAWLALRPAHAGRAVRTPGETRRDRRPADG